MQSVLEKLRENELNTGMLTTRTHGIINICVSGVNFRTGHLRYMSVQKLSEMQPLTGRKRGLFKQNEKNYSYVPFDELLEFIPTTAAN